MRSDFRFRFIFHIKHDINFDDVYNNVELNIKKMKIRHYVFVITHVKHQFVLKQSFLIDVSVNYDYRFDEIYVMFTNFDLNRFVIFKILDKNYFANQIEKDVFFDDDHFLN